MVVASYEEMLGIVKDYFWAFLKRAGAVFCIKRNSFLQSIIKISNENIGMYRTGKI
jgi:hypothetical protein